MKCSLNWLHEHLDLDSSVSKEVLAQTLTNLGMEVERLENPWEILKDFIIVEVLEALPHPQADRLQVLKVSTGQETLTVVCGDLTVVAGIKSVLGRPGTFVPGAQITLKKSKIRGIESHGMLCSLKELGLAENSQGVIQLPAEAPTGLSYVSYIKAHDILMDLSITPNRGDCLSVRGIARELGAKGLGSLKPLEVPPVPGTFDNPYGVRILFEGSEIPQAQAPCTFFSGRLIRGVHNGPSPQWLKRRLESVGLRSVSALVDITNFLCLDQGQPLHVYDADTFQGSLEVRLSRHGESFTSLEGRSYDLGDTSIVVADESSVLSLAGVMGSQASGCTHSTQNVYLESALFDPVSIARTGRSFGILSEARYRFERGVDGAQVLQALERATALILEVCGGEASHVSVVGDAPPAPPAILFSPKRVKKLSGMEVSSTTITNSLKALGFQVCPQTSDSEKIMVQPPSWRHDIFGQEDLVEEVLRLTGFESIPLLPFSCDPLDSPSFQNLHQENSHRDIQGWTCRRILAERGFSEAMTWSFISAEEAPLWGSTPEDLELDNPMSEELSVMRWSLFPHVLRGISKNRTRTQGPIALFELGACYREATPSGQKTCVVGVRAQEEGPKSWKTPVRAPDLWDIKADAVSVLEACGISPESLTVSTDPSQELPYYHPGQWGLLTRGPQKILGSFGVLHPRLQKFYDLDTGVVAFEIFLEDLPPGNSKKIPGAYRPSPYQSVERDFAFVVEAVLPAQVLIKTIQKVDPELITQVRVFDVYQGPHVPEGKKSLGLCVQMLSMHKTLTEEDITGLSQKIIQAVHHKTGGFLRQ